MYHVDRLNEVAGMDTRSLADDLDRLTEQFVAAYQARLAVE